MLRGSVKKYIAGLPALDPSVTIYFFVHIKLIEQYHFTRLGPVLVSKEGWYQQVPIMFITWVLIVDVLLMPLLPAFCNMFLLVSSIK